jgi:glycosyltransferase involved in cell wall biosynthesis
MDFAPDTIHVHLFHALALVASLPRPIGARLILTHHHGSRYVDERQRGREIIDRTCGRRFDAVVAVSEATRRLLLERYRYPVERVHTIVNGWSGTPLPKKKITAQRVICVANFRAQKGHDVLLEAFSQVALKVPEAELVLVGDGPLRPKLERQANRLGLGGQVRFEGPVRDVWPLLSESEVFALASRYEPLGLAVLEAMAAGLPVVTTAVGGLVDLVEDGVTGYTVSADHPGELADRIIQLLEAGHLHAEMSAAASERASHHKADDMVERYLELYDLLLRSRGRRRN